MFGTTKTLGKVLNTGTRRRFLGRNGVSKLQEQFLTNGSLGRGHGQPDKWPDVFEPHAKHRFKDGY